MEANNDTAIYFELLAEERQAIAEQNRLNAQRYEKLKAYSDECKDWQWSDLWEQPNLDSAVDALPEPGQKGGE